MAAGCGAIQCCDTAEHAPRYDWEACDTTEGGYDTKLSSVQRHSALGTSCDTAERAI